MPPVPKAIKYNPTLTDAMDRNEGIEVTNTHINPSRYTTDK
jgi:hypothetical protein